MLPGLAILLASALLALAAASAILAAISGAGLSFPGQSPRQPAVTTAAACGAPLHRSAEAPDRVGSAPCIPLFASIARGLAAVRRLRHGNPSKRLLRIAAAPVIPLVRAMLA